MKKKTYNNWCGSLNYIAQAYIRMGFCSLLHSPVKIAISVIYWGLIVFLICQYNSLFALSKWEVVLLMPIVYCLFPIAAAASFVLGIALSVVPRRAQQIATALRRAGIVNKLNEVPIPCSVSDNEIVVMANGVSLETFNDRLSEMETALNKRIVRMSEGVDKRHMVIRTAPGDAKLPDMVELDIDNLPKKASVLALGEAIDGQLCVDLQKTPHVLIGSSSGGGKTNAIISIIVQALAKNMQVYVFDPKGGVDLGRWIKDACDFSDDPAMILSELSYLVRELYARIEKFKGIERLFQTACPNIETYNLLCSEENLSRILIIFDEVAMITDTTGLDKEHKARAATIVSHLSDIARLGRAFGIHLIIATQRPDANAVPGQIKNNLDVRIAGRSDLVLSQIILDNGDAASIPKDKPGRFIANVDGGTEFQGYYVDMSKIE